MDLAEQIDDFIPTLKSSSNSEMDSLIMLIFIVTIVTLFLVWLGRFLYQKWLAKKAAAVETAKTDAKLTTSASVASSPLVAKAAATPLSSAKSAGSSPFASSLGSRGGGGGGGGAAMPVAKSRSLSQQSLNSGARKRLTRKSPGPEIQQRRSRSIPPPASVSGPDDTTATWTSHVFKWLYSDLVIVNDLLYGFITAINQTMARNTSENGILVEVVRVLPESSAPNISNIFCDKSMTTNTSEVVITMDIETTIVLQVKAFRQVSGKADVLHYRATIRFKGHLSIAMNYLNLVGEMRVEGYPDVKINIASIGPIKTTGKEETEIQDMISETLNLTVREVLYPIDFSVHSTCPRALKMEADNYYDNQHMDFPDPFNYMAGDHHQMQMPYNDGHSTRGGSMSQGHGQMMSPAGRRLLVKIVKGEALMQAKDPYVTVEMDEPPQKNQTGARQGTSPYWDEHFLFDLSHASSEILFEVYDRPVNPNDYPKFLGLGLVGIDELAVGPSSSQIIALQPRPYETDPVSGAINVEFVFIEGAQVPVSPRRPYKLKEALKLDPHQMDQMSYEAPSHNINPSRLSPMLQQRQMPQQQQQPYMNGNGQHLVSRNFSFNAVLGDFPSLPPRGALRTSAGG
jgi:C2 domain